VRSILEKMIELALLSILIILIIILSGMLFLVFGKLKLVQYSTEKEIRRNRDDVKDFLTMSNKNMSERFVEAASHQQRHLDHFSKQLQQLTKTTSEGMELMRTSVEKKLTILQDDNSKKLEKMRETVDEKLQSTLEKRLGESFKLVSDRLELVHKGLGEMKTLANGVGDLKKVLSNVKTRGMWGEVQLSQLLEQILTPEQYEENVTTKPRGRERVEFAIKLPGKGDKLDAPVWLPIDAKFPQDLYQQLIDAQESADVARVAVMTKQLLQHITQEARSINEKYISPPHTTDFGILFLPIEGLYAEVLRHPSIQEKLQRDYRVMIAGPTTLGALLNSLQMGFRTLAIEKRSSDVWKVLGSVKTEFGKFTEILSKTKKKIDSIGTTLEEAASKSRTIERKLQKVESVEKIEAPSEGLDVLPLNL
jgi:DNA recombination protein RmuC